MTGSADEATEAGLRGETGPSCRPTVSHNLDPAICLRCGVKPRKGGTVWCIDCINRGKQAAKDSTRRQILAGMQFEEHNDSIRVKNWKPGDPFWWKASGCYGE